MTRVPKNGPKIVAHTVPLYRPRMESIRETAAGITANMLRNINWNIACMRSAMAYAGASSRTSRLSRHGRSSIDLVLIEDLKPRFREQSGKEQWV